LEALKTHFSMRNIIWLSLIVIVCHQKTQAQLDSLDSHKEKHQHFLPKTILPATFILTGVLLNNSQSEKKWQRDIRNKVGNDYHNGIDDYIQYIPFAEVYLADLAGVKSKNHWFDQTKNMIFSGLGTMVVVHSFKRGIGKTRPDGSSNHSFPSGHTSTAFVGATILYHEFKDTNPVLAYSGFLFATATGSFRVMNNRHFVSDVLTGAGIGILVSNMVYYLEPLKNWNPVTKDNNLTFFPIMNSEEVTFVFAYKF
jgi:hypothetical protein